MISHGSVFLNSQGNLTILPLSPLQRCGPASIGRQERGDRTPMRASQAGPSVSEWRHGYVSDSEEDPGPSTTANTNEGQVAAEKFKGERIKPSTAQMKVESGEGKQILKNGCPSCKVVCQL